MATKNKSIIGMDKWTKRGAIVGGIWGFLSSIFVIGRSLLPVGYTQFFTKASLMHWIIYFPGMFGAFLDYHKLLGFRLGIFLIIPAILIGVIVGYGIALLTKKIGGVLKCEKSIP